MAKGLSDTQKTILKVINDQPYGKNRLYFDIYPIIKARLFPKLYALQPPDYIQESWGETCKRLTAPGYYQSEKRAAKVTLNKSIRRLEKRGLISISNESRQMWISPGIKYFGEGESPVIWNVDCVYLTEAGRLMANQVPQGKPVTQYAETATVVEDYDSVNQ